MGTRPESPIASTPSVNLPEILPFRNFNEWLTWKRSREHIEETHDSLFADPDFDRYGFGSIVPFESADRANDIPGVLGSLDLMADETTTVLHLLGTAIAIIHVYGGDIDLDRFGQRIDLKKMMDTDAVTILLDRLKVDSDFNQKWDQTRNSILRKETQLGSYQAQRGDDRPANVFLTLTFRILRENTKLPLAEIKNIQKRLYTHFISDDGARGGPALCRYCVTRQGYSTHTPKYVEGKLIEEQMTLKWSKELRARDYHPGRHGGPNPADTYTCPSYRDESHRARSGATHCRNGHLCKIIDDKVDSWYRTARKRGLLKLWGK